MSLKAFEKNIQSQFGEDGVIEEIFNRIGTTNKVCVEFGAWDGIYLSNTWNLWHNKDWFAYLIEGDEEKAHLLEQNLMPYDRVKSLNSFVMPQGEFSLDSILSKYSIPKDFDLLSIDIDGDDYHILKHLQNYKPNLIIIEFNPTVPPHIEMVQETGEYMGASSLSIVNLAKEKGYKPIHITDVNLFLIRDEIYDLGLFDEFDLDRQFKKSHLVNVITTFDGIPFLSCNLPYKPKLPTHEKINFKWALKTALNPKKINIIEPKFTSTNSLIPVNIYEK